MEKNKGFEENEELTTLKKYIDYVIAILLLTGQLTITGVFVRAGGFSIALGGPIIGSTRLEGKSECKKEKNTANLLIGVIDMILVLLIFTEQIGILGVFVSPEKLTLTVSGPIFGEVNLVGNADVLRENARNLNKIVPDHLKMDSKAMKKLLKEGIK